MMMFLHLFSKVGIGYEGLCRPLIYIGDEPLVVKTEDIHPPKTGISVHFCVLSLMAMQN
jgi:hypothetical protein